MISGTTLASLNRKCGPGEGVCQTRSKNKLIEAAGFEPAIFTTQSFRSNLGQEFQGELSSNPILRTIRAQERRLTTRACLTDVSQVTIGEHHLQHRYKRIKSWCISLVVEWTFRKSSLTSPLAILSVHFVIAGQQRLPLFIN